MFTRTLRKGRIQALLGVLVIALVLAVSKIVAADAAAVVVSGTVTYPDGSAAPNIQVELHLADGTVTYSAPTDSSGNFSFDQTLTPNRQYTLEVSTPSGYNRPTNSPYIFTYQSGDAPRTGIIFALQAANKIVTGRVTLKDGTIVSNADVRATPVEGNPNPLASARTAADGTYTMDVISGAYYVQALANFSEWDVEWIMEDKPVRVEFKNDSSVETATVNFTATKATGQLRVILLNSDSSKLTTSDFVADISVFRADGAGTIRKVKAEDSSLPLFLTPGIYQISAFHQDLAGKSFNIEPFVITEGGITDLGTVRAETNSAHLQGAVRDATGKGIANMPVQAIREGGAERPSTTTDGDGQFDMTVGAGTWIVGPNFSRSDSTQYRQAAPVTTTVKNGETVTGLDITFAELDRTISGNILNAAGTKITDFIGSVYVRTANNKIRVAAPVVNGAYTLSFSSADISGKNVIVGVEADPGSANGGKAEKVVKMSGDTATQDMTLATYDAALTGTLQVNGAAITNPGSDIEVLAVDTKGNAVSTLAADDGSYTLALSAGTWTYSYHVDDPAAANGLLDRPAFEETITVAAGQTVTKNIAVLQGTNTITGTVKDSASAAVKSAAVTVDNRPSIENNSANNPNKITAVTVMTDENGVYTVKVPNGTYRVTAGDTPFVDDHDLQPDAKTVTVSGASSTTVNLAFEASNATLKGKATTRGAAEAGVTVTAWTDDGGQVKTITDANGSYTLPVTKSEQWHVVAQDIGGTTLMASDQADKTVRAGTTTLNLALKDTNEVVPGPAKKSFGADETGTVSTPDGATFTFPPYAVDLSGTVTVTVTPVPGEPTAGGVAAGLTYDVTATDNTGRAVKALNREATVTIPYPEQGIARKGLSEKTIATEYFDPNTKQWQNLLGVVDTKNNVATFVTDHLTKFSVAGVQKPKPTYKGFVVKSVGRTAAVIQINGTNFSGKVTVTMNGVKATRVQVKNSTTLLVTLPIGKLKAGRQTVVITNGNGRTVTQANVVTLKKIGSGFTIASFRAKQ